ncbi:MAG: hypothetical protein UR27_C0001G0014 [Candidatus Peregrinibacteria bacterium GW2011_GWA2_33_10]|nr:MAG: hypothetical protein UR27_C0001G0014 [Candidatus Peregrinibacteria bacterium GW2011_GWA2_33_10]KKP39744.1 MAG: hypothetical protein UR30_C0008G0013 [Candidatus Peregrinibacteria bacterium GW2011_GWC2_33_13]OGJ50432.1 MAG: hypothetical protein A2229_02420 [Candidatus Peregrinibacteria bacterium RIFOXYA2_FULL_33_7]
MNKDSKLQKFVQDTKKSIKNIKEKISTNKKTVANKEEKISKINLPDKLQQKQGQLVHISSISVAKATVVIILLYVLSLWVAKISDILILFFIAYFLSAALDPTIDYLEKKRIPRSAGILFIFLLIFSGLIFFLSNLAPLIATQILELANKIQDMVINLTRDNPESKIPFFDKIKPLLNQFIDTIDRETLTNSITETLRKIGSTLESFAGNAFRALSAIFQSIANAVVVLVLTFFMSVNEKSIERFFTSLFPSKHTQYILNKSEDIKNKVGFWLRGQIILGIFIGVLTMIALSIIGVKYALTLSMISGIMEFIPVIGPILTFIISIPIVLNQDPILIIWVAIAFIVIQQLENNVLVPLIMKKSTGLSPIIIIFAMLVGYRFLGILGMILSVPVATIISIFVYDYVKKEK